MAHATSGPVVDKVYFELSNACNFKCDYCPRTFAGRPLHFMEMELFRKGVDEIVAQRLANEVGFHVLGEPLMSPLLIPCVRYAKERGLFTEVTTNGSLLPRLLPRLIEAGPAKVSISLQSSDPGHHASRGTRIPFDAYYGGVIDSVRRLRQDAPDTLVDVSVLNTSSRRYFTFAKPLGIDMAGRAYQRNLSTVVAHLCAAIGRPRSVSEIRKALCGVGLGSPRTLWLDARVAVVVAMLGDWGNAFAARRVYPARFGYCGYALASVGVLSTGEVTICCADYDGRTTLGNLHCDSLLALLSSDRAEAIRAGFRRLRVIHPRCQRCLGGRSPLEALVKGLVSVYLFKVAHPLKRPAVRLFV